MKNFLKKDQQVEEKNKQRLELSKSEIHPPCPECKRLDDIANAAGRKYSENANIRNKICATAGELSPSCINYTKICDDLYDKMVIAHEIWDEHYNSPHDKK